ncbi:MAG: serine dehydratase beta chain, partial [Bacteroidota bacterium]
MEAISVFDMLKIGVGPSSSHTLGPWRAALLFLQKLEHEAKLPSCDTILVELYGSLALTGKGHGTDIAIMMGLCGKDPVTVPVEQVTKIPEAIQRNKQLFLAEKHWITFDPAIDIIMHTSESLPTHANGMRLLAFRNNELLSQGTYYSIGGG